MSADEHLNAGPLRAAVLDRANMVDARVQALLDRLDLSGSGPEHERLLDAIMGLCLAADAARAFARDDVETANELAKAMGRYANKVLDAE